MEFRNFNIKRMSDLGILCTLSIGLILSTFGCNPSSGIPQKIRKLVFGGSRFSEPLTMTIPAEDSRKRFNELRQSPVVKWAIVTGSCGGGPCALDRIDRNLLSFVLQNGYATVEELTVHKKPGWPFASAAGPEHLKFLFYTHKLKRFIHAKGADLFGKENMEITMASRRLVSIDYTNQYEGSPMGIQTKFYALTFSYVLEEKLPGLPRVTKQFQGKAKAYLDPDDGQWKLQGIQLEDSGSWEYINLITSQYEDTRKKEKAEKRKKRKQARARKKN